ncbi:MAG TPA: hypothetical protein VD931_18750, partial [Baekduia sp.]|nr:hypothetical protein [Baekduia sp.]
MQRLGRAVLVAGALVALSPTRADAAVQLRGGEASRMTLCGAMRTATAVAPGAVVRAVVAPARAARSRRARWGATLEISRCDAGRWRTVRRLPVGEDHAMDTGREATGDYRVRIRRRDGVGGRSAFLRVGVGEVVDVPVAFGVVNVNRSRVPCLPGPDGRPYTVRGTLVAPRSVLRERRAVTLYAHGLSYASHFFRLQS